MHLTVILHTTLYKTLFHTKSCSSKPMMMVNLPLQALFIVLISLSFWIARRMAMAGALLSMCLYGKYGIHLHLFPLIDIGRQSQKGGGQRGSSLRRITQHLA
jgi:hypothetical protein